MSAYKNNIAYVSTIYTMPIQPILHNISRITSKI